MELDTFITTTLEQIVNGVAVAAERTSSRGAVICPSRAQYQTAQHMAESPGMIDARDWVPLQVVKFDVAVTVTGETANEAGGGVRISVLQGGAKHTSSEQQESVQHIGFEVPIKLPVPTQT